MTQRWRILPFLRAAALGAAVLMVLASCSLPKIIILHDPLTAEEHDELGRSYESKGELKLAAQQYQEALRLDKKHLPSLLLLGDLSYRVNDYETAEQAYEKALKLDPKNGDIRNNLAWVYLKTGRHLDKALDLINEALTLNAANRPYYLDTLGVVLLRLGKANDAIKALQESTATIPGDKTELSAEATGHLAEAYKAVNDEERYRAALERQRQLQKSAAP